jgi:hypothetical protein
MGPRSILDFDQFTGRAPQDLSTQAPGDAGVPRDLALPPKDGPVPRDMNRPLDAGQTALFGPAVQLPAPQGMPCYVAIAIDHLIGPPDATGYPDVGAVASCQKGASTFYAWANDSMAGFAAPTETDVMASGAAAFAVGDFDGLGGRDVAVANTPGVSLSILLGDGQGGYVLSMKGPRLDVAGATNPTPIALAAADLDGDSHDDLVVATPGGKQVCVAWGSATGDFTIVADPRISPTAIVLGQFDPLVDSPLDVAVDGVDNAGANALEIAINLGQRSFGNPSTIPSPAAFGPIAVGEFSGDAIDDLAVGVGNEVKVVSSDPMGNYAISASLGLGSPISRLAAADFDGNGLSNVAILLPGGTSVPVFAVENGGLALLDKVTLPGPGVALAAGDVTGDGKPDLLVGGDGFLVLFVNQN